MKAIVATPQHTLIDTELPQPTAQGHDLLVRIDAISVNPVDFKVRQSDAPEPRVLGYDAAGTVVAVGAQASLFKPGDKVYYAGSIARPGANSEYHLVDERIAALAPATLSATDAAALPLTSITAWEALFERLAISREGAHAGRSLLVIGGAGGVGSIAIQLAKKLAGLHVVATASRPETAAWVRELGADHVIDHHGDIPAQLKAAGLPNVDYVLVLYATDDHFAAAAEAIAPQGRIVSIVPSTKPLPMELLFLKSASFAWEMMFTRSSFQTADMIEQHKLLTEVAKLVDAGTLRATTSESLGTINAANLSRAHAILESGRAIGKLVLAGF